MSGGALFLWYESGAEEAAEFYAATFPDSQVAAVSRVPGQPGGVQTVDSPCSAFAAWGSTAGLT